MSGLRIAFGWATLSVALAVALLAVVPGELFGKPPPPPPPPPPPAGTILFAQDRGNGDEFWQMKADGTNKAVTFVPPVDPEFTTFRPSHRSTQRWWLFKAVDDQQQHNLYATDGDAVVQITNVSTTVTGNIEEVTRVLGFTPSWSNDGLDSFMSLVAVTFQQDAVTDEVYSASWYIAVLRHPTENRPLNIGDLDAAADGANLGLNEDDFVQVIATSQESSNLYEHWWSPDGTRLAYLFHDSSDPLENPSDSDLYVGDVSSALATGIPLDPRGLKIFNALTEGLNASVRSPRWSRTLGVDKIAFTYKNRLYTRRPDQHYTLQTSGPLLSVDAITPAWSLDDQFLACTTRTFKGAKTYYDVVRLPSTGGTTTSLTGDIDRTVFKSVVGWGQ